MANFVNTKKKVMENADGNNKDGEQQSVSSTGIGIFTVFTEIFIVLLFYLLCQVDYVEMYPVW